MAHSISPSAGQAINVTTAIGLGRIASAASRQQERRRGMEMRTQNSLSSDFALRTILASRAAAIYLLKRHPHSDRVSIRA